MSQSRSNTQQSSPNFGWPTRDFLVAKSPSEPPSPPSSPTPSPPSSPSPSPSPPRKSALDNRSRRRRRTSSMKPWIPRFHSQRSPGYPPDLPSPPSSPPPKLPPLIIFPSQSYTSQAITTWGRRPRPRPADFPPIYPTPPYHPPTGGRRHHEGYSDMPLSPMLDYNRRDAICLSPRTQVLADAYFRGL